MPFVHDTLTELELSSRPGSRADQRVILLETQASPNPRKPLTWDLYHLLIVLFHEVDPEILLVALGTPMEETCRGLIARVRVAQIYLVGPSTLPQGVPADVHVAAAAVAILKDQTPRELAEHALRGLIRHLPDPHSGDYYWMVCACLPEQLRQELMMSLKHESYFTEEEQAALTILRNRGIEPSTELMVELEGIPDQDRLIAIVGRAAIVETLEQLLRELHVEL